MPLCLSESTKTPQDIRTISVGAPAACSDDSGTRWFGLVMKRDSQTSEEWESQGSFYAFLQGTNERMGSHEGEALVPYMSPTPEGENAIADETQYDRQIWSVFVAWEYEKH